MADNNINNDNAKETLKTFDQLLNIAEKLNGKFREGNKLTDEQKDLSADHAKTLTEIKKHQKDSTKLADISYDLEQKLLIAQESGNKELVKEIKLSQKLVKIKQKENEAQEKIKSAYKEIGGQLGLGGLIGLHEKWKELDKEKDKNTGSMLKKLMISGLVIGGIISLVSLVSSITDEIGSNFGAIGTTSQGLFDTLTDVRAEAIGLGFSAEEAYQSMDALTGTLGIGYEAAAQLAESTMDTSKSLGLGVSEGAALTAIIANTTSTSAEGAQNFLKQTAALAQASKVAPKDVLNDMAQSSEEIATYTEGTGENMVRAAIQARKMGMSLSDLAKTADGLLDFQSSISAEMQASVLIGRQINLQRARQLALDGKLAEMGEEILKQVGSEAEWNELNSIQRKALADSVGVGVAQMSKMVKESGKSADEIARMRSMDIGELIPSETMSGITFLTNQLKKLGATILGEIADQVNKIDFSEMVKWVKDLGVKVREVAVQIKDWFVGLASATDETGNIEEGTASLSQLFTNISGQITEFIDKWGWVAKAILYSQILMAAYNVGVGAAIIAQTTWNGLQTAWNFLITKGKAKAGLMWVAQKGMAATQKVINGLTTAFNFLTDTARIKLVAMGIATKAVAVGQGIMNGLATVFNLLMNANPIGLIVMGVVALGIAIYEVWKHWDTIQAKLMAIWEWAKGGILTLGSKLLEGIKSAANAIFDAITWPYRKAWEWVSSLWGGESPSQVGLSMLTGIQSVEADIEKSLVKPFEAAATKIDATGPGKIGAGVGGTTQMATMKSEINKLNTSLNRLIDNFDKNYIPAIVASNIDGAKKSSREVSRQFQMNSGG